MSGSPSAQLQRRGMVWLTYVRRNSSPHRDGGRRAIAARRATFSARPGAAQVCGGLIVHARKRPKRRVHAARSPQSTRRPQWTLGMLIHHHLCALRDLCGEYVHGRSFTAERAETAEDIGYAHSPSFSAPSAISAVNRFTDPRFTAEHAETAEDIGYAHSPSSLRPPRSLR